MSERLTPKQRFTERRGILLIILAPVVFVLSMLFLANMQLYPSNSIPYVIGLFLCFFVSPFLFVFGIIVYIIARRRAPKIKPIPPKTLVGRKSEKPYLLASKGEIYIRKILGVLIILFISLLLSHLV